MFPSPFFRSKFLGINNSQDDIKDPKLIKLLIPVKKCD